MSPWSVNPCRDPSLNASIPVAGIGSGAAWQSPREKGKYIINYSESIRHSPVGQQIRYSISYDLKTWTPARDVPPFHEDGDLYRAGRWDTIVQFTDAAGLMHGWWTATPRAKPPVVRGGVAMAAFGYGTSADGLQWALEPPAWVVVPTGMATSNQVEVGGVAQLSNGRWYAQVCAIYWGHIDNLGGCFSAMADAPGGPYVLQRRNYALLGYAKTDGIPAYFSRFYSGPSNVTLVNYQQGHSQSGRTFLAPLKRVLIDPSEGLTLRWAWYDANDALKSTPVGGVSVDVATGLLSPPLDISRGSVVEGTLTWANGQMHFCAGDDVGGEGGSGGCFGKLALNRTVLELYRAANLSAPTSVQGLGEAAPQPSRSLRIAAGERVRWRLLLRQGLYELYLSEGARPSSDMYFAASYYAAIPMAANTSRLKLTGSFAQSSGLDAWTMSLSAAVSDRETSRSN